MPDGACPGLTSELARLRASYRAAIARGGGTAVLTGDSGSGCPDLVNRLVVEATAGGATVWRARCVDGMPELDTAREVLRVAGGARDEDDDATSLAERLIARVPDTPLLVALEDVHLADADSLDVLLEVNRHLQGRPAHLLLHHQPLGMFTHVEFWAEILRLRNSQWVEVPHLRPPQVNELARAVLGHAVPSEFVVACLARSGGNYALVKGLLDATAAAGGVQPARTGQAYERAVLTTLHGCPPTTVRVARCLAVIGESRDTCGEVAELTGIEFEEVNRALRVLTDLGFLHDGAFRDPAAREAIRHCTDLRERQELCLAAARSRRDKGAQAREIARLVLRGGREARDEKWRRPILRAAALESLADDDPHAALDYLKAAAQGPMSVENRTKILCDALNLGWRIDPASCGDSLSALVGIASSGTLPLRDRLHLVGHLAWAGRMDDLLLLLGRPGFAPISWAWLLAIVPGLVPELDRDVFAADDEEGPDLALLPLSLATRAWQGALQPRPAPGAREDANAMVRRVLDGCSLGHETLVAIVIALAVLLLHDETTEVAERSARLVTQAGHLSAPVWAAIFEAVAAENALRRGDVEHARRHGEASLERIPPRAWGAFVGFPIGTLLDVCARTGDHERAAELMSIPVPVSSVVTWSGLRHLRARGACHLAVGHDYNALQDFLECGARLRAWGLEETTVFDWQTPIRGIVGRSASPGVEDDAGDPPADAPAEPDGSSCVVDVSELSPAELRVARLAAQGLSNKEISRKLFITVSTVEQHLTRVYRKLEATDRSALLGVLRGDPIAR